MSSGYSPWIWSPEHRRHYCWRHNENGIVEYQWSGSPRSYANTPTTQTQTSLHLRMIPSEGKDEDGEEGKGKDENEDEDESEDENEDEHQPQPAATAQQSRRYRAPSYSHSNQNAPMQYTQSYRVGQQPVSPSTYLRYTYQQLPYLNSAQPVSPSTYPHYTHQQLPYLNSAQPVASLPAQPVNQQKVRHIRTGIDGRDDEVLDPRYKRVSPRSQANFFCYGRIFMMLWTEPAGQANPGRTRGSTHFSVVKYSETAYSEIRRFVVVRNKGTFSQCVPVQTYRRQGATKVGVLVEDHAVIYTGGEGDAPPPLLEGEGITKQALRVVTNGNEVLDTCSRINFRKTYTVEHNVKVLSIGVVAPEHNHLVENYWRMAHDLDGGWPTPKQLPLPILKQSAPQAIKESSLPTPKQSAPPTIRESTPNAIMDLVSQALPHANDQNTADIGHLLDPESYFAGLEDLEAKVAMECDLNVKSSWTEANTLQQPVDPTLWGQIFAKIMSAFELLQESGFSTSYFTILVQCPDRSDVAIAVPVHMEMLRSLVSVCRAVSGLCEEKKMWLEDTEYCYKCLTELEKESTRMFSHLSMLPINQVTTIPLSVMDRFEYLPTNAKPRILQTQSILTWLYRALSLGLVSYTGSHACDFDLSVFKRERATFLIDEHYIFCRRALACLNDFVGSSVWILGPPHNIVTCYLVSITPQDFVDLWGPLWAIPAEAADEGFYELRTQDGAIHAATQLESTHRKLKPNETMCHWVKYDNYSTLGSSHYGDRHLDGVTVMPAIIPKQGRLLIGVSSNTANLDQKAFIWNQECERDIAAVQKLIACDLRFPGVSCGRYEVDAYQVNASGGYFITTAITKTWKRVPPTTHKNRLIAHCKNPLNSPLPIAILQLRVGLEVSVCTGNAQRVSLWSIMKLLHMQNAGKPFYQECEHPVGEPRCVTTCWNSFGAGKSVAILPKPDILLNDVIVSALLKLEATGVDAAGCLQAWWPFTDSPNTLKLETTSREATHKWIPVLKDSRDASTFAIMSARCFEYPSKDRVYNTSLSRKCSNRSKSQSTNAAGQYTHTLLHTLIQLHPASRVQQGGLDATLRHYPNQISLPVGACLRLGDVGSLEIVNRGNPQLTLLKNGFMATVSENVTWIASGDRGHRHRELVDETNTGKTLSVVIM